MEHEYIKVGYLKKSHGLAGHMKLAIDFAYYEDFNYLETFFLKLRGSWVPYFLEELNPGNNIFIKFEGIDSREAADKIASREIFVREDHLQTGLKEPDRSHLEFGAYFNFEMHDLNLGKLGTIIAIEEFPNQEMAVLEYKGKEVFIPLNNSYILSQDSDKKILRVDLPEGLLNI